MLPADLLGTWIEHRPIFSAYGDDPAVRSIVVSYVTNILVNVLTALIAFRLLGQLRFSVKESVAGVLALLFCTTHLHYTQNMMENNYIILLTLIGFSYQFDWLRSGSRRALFIGSFALGLNLLTRLPTGLDLIASGIFLLLVLWFEAREATGVSPVLAGRIEGRRGGPALHRQTQRSKPHSVAVYGAASPPIARSQHPFIFSFSPSIAPTSFTASDLLPIPT